MFSPVDESLMRLALAEAERGLWSTTPNPRVGCVIARDGQVLGSGWHRRAGEPHAEVHALRAAGEQARGGTAYVTLEPCSHHGRTPPCAEALVAAGVARVVVAMTDPNPLVAGRGIDRLRAAGIQVDVGLLETEAKALNPGFISRMTRQRPWVRLKVASSLDGRTALANGVSQWITGAAARADGHAWRARACAILTGSGTALADNPQLNVREVDWQQQPADLPQRQPLRVVVDSRLQLPPSLALCAPNTLLATTATGSQAAAEAWSQAGAEVWRGPALAGHVDLAALLQELARRGCNEVHVEAGAGLNGALLAAGLVDEIVWYMAPCILGNVGRGAFAVPELTALEQRYQLTDVNWAPVGMDWRLRARLQSR
jgi:diaminohydroxyphosphoribosylaminopyrimidine deaminase/5-amino-6-(5-phosphoribosylamino)uracil reductase